MMILFRLLASFFRPAGGGNVAKLPTGIVADNVGEWGQFGLQQNINQWAMNLQSTATGGTNVNLTAAQVLSGAPMLNAGSGGFFTLTLPSTPSMMAALPNTIPTDGSYQQPILFIMNNPGNGATLTAGDAQTAIQGAAALGSNATTVFMMRVLSSANLSFTRIGTMPI